MAGLLWSYCCHSQYQVHYSSLLTLLRLPSGSKNFRFHIKGKEKMKRVTEFCDVLSSRIIHHVSRTLSRHYVCCMDVQLHPDLKACGAVQDLISQRYWQRWMMPQNSHAQGWDGQQREGGCHCVCVPRPTHEHFWTLIQVNTILMVKLRAKAKEGRPDADQVQGGEGQLNCFRINTSIF